MKPKVLIPFDLPVYKGCNANHPLLTCLVELQYDGFDPVRLNRGCYPPASPAETCMAAANFSSAMARKMPAQIGPYSRDDFVINYIVSRDLLSQQMVSNVPDLAVFHTVPFHLDQIDHVLHIESVGQMFRPFVAQGFPTKVPLKEIPIYWIVKALLESPRCRGIFTNLKMTKAQLSTMFESKIIDNKTTHCAAGAFFSEEQKVRVEKIRAAKVGRKELKILFTNSWHDDPTSFYLRGGLDTLLAFLELQQRYPDIRLILRSSVPQPVLEHPELGKMIVSNPAIQFVNERLTDDQVLDLYADSDIFMLDSVGLHSVSVLRAMNCGLVSVVSDAPGWDEYVTDDVNGIVVPGRREKINGVDQSTGFITDDYTEFLANPVNLDRVGILIPVLERLITSPDLRARLVEGGFQTVRTTNSLEVWRSGFEQLILNALN